MTTEENILKLKYAQAGQLIVRAGIMPFAVSDTFIEILKFYLDDEDLDFIINNYNEKNSLSHDELKEKSKLSDSAIKRITGKLAKKGFIFNQQSSSGLMVYRLLPIIVVGTFEYTFMNELPEGGDKLKDLKKVAKLYEKLLEELKINIQQGYDALLPIFEQQPPVDRTIPIFKKEDGGSIEIKINQDVKAEEQILPAKTVEDIINKYNDIAVGYCFCRNYNKVLGHNCESDAPNEVCFTFGKSARHTVEQGFARMVSRKEALDILQKTEEAGLVHKAFHNGSNIHKDENSICNCCKDCCDTFTLWRRGATPMINSTNYLSVIDEGLCSGCGTCVEKCPVDAIELNSGGIAVREENHCIGCGVCARFCPDDAISLIEGMRHVYLPPPRVKS